MQFEYFVLSVSTRKVLAGFMTATHAHEFANHPDRIVVTSNYLKSNYA